MPEDDPEGSKRVHVEVWITKCCAFSWCFTYLCNPMHGHAACRVLVWFGGVCCSEMLCTVDWSLVVDILGQPMPRFKNTKSFNLESLGCPEMSVTTNQRCITSQKTEYLIYTAAGLFTSPSRTVWFSLCLLTAGLGQDFGTEDVRHTVRVRYWQESWRRKVLWKIDLWLEAEPRIQIV
jgi:hypothetical protein